MRRGGFYAHQARHHCSRRVYDRVLQTQIQNVFYESRCVYGARKIRALLSGRGYRCSRRRVRRLMESAGLVSVVSRRYRATTNSKHKLPVAKNLLSQRFTVEEPNRIWVSDITYIPTREGWLYLCVVLDLYARRVVSWSVSDRIDRHLATDALRKALESRKPLPGLIVHTDRGSVYCSRDFQNMLHEARALSSMSAPGTPYDNACAESFFRSLKVECIHLSSFATRSTATDRVRWYIELFYNRVRPHASLGYLAPCQVEVSA